jgi:xanthine dehydrogenase YagS FAD-binding subunit
MRSFAYTQAASADAALQAAQAANAAAGTPRDVAQPQAPVQFLAGGTTLLDLMKLDVMQPHTLIDLQRLRPARGRGIEAGADGLRLDAAVSMADAAAHPLVLRDYPVIAESLLLAASAQLRNMASLGGNVLQRTRCAYFRDVHWSACNKRTPGSGCAALDGQNRQHAILGTSEHCIATYPGDFAQALIALDAVVEISAPGGARRLPFAELHRRPGGTPQIETRLAPGELITALVVPAGPWTRRSRYLKIRDRVSYQFALTSAAVALDLQQGVVQTARIALGGVATVPWRAREAEQRLQGRRLDEASALEAAEAAFAGAQVREHNAYKLELGQQTLVRALLEVAALPA